MEKSGTRPAAGARFLHDDLPEGFTAVLPALVRRAASGHPCRSPGFMIKRHLWVPSARKNPHKCLLIMVGSCDPALVPVSAGPPVRRPS
jgi:hypothetical protein